MDNKLTDLSTKVTKDILDREMLKFTLNLYNNPLLSRKAVDEIINIFDDFISHFFIPFVQNKMEDQLRPITDEQSFFKTQFILEDSKKLFRNFSTEHLRFNRYKQDSLFIAPNTFEIGEVPVFEEDSEKQVKVGMKKVYAAHVSLPQVLTKVLEVPDTFQQIKDFINNIPEDSDILSHFMQGNLWKTKYVPKNQGKIVLPLFLYYDDFETGNGMGSHAGEQKLGGVYASLACLPPHLTAKLENIFVSTICYTKHIKELKNERIFYKTIKDLNILSKDGIEICLDQQKERVYFECVLVLGDNLGMNCICGFSQSFTASRYCRICSATIIQCHRMIVEDERFIRSVDSYNRDVRRNNFSETGIREECIFNNVNNFHIAQNLSVDVMHDFFEGVAVYSISKILHTYVLEKKILSLDVLNNRIDSFSYGFEISNKPRPLYFASAKKGGSKLKVRQSAAEMLCLARYLGLIIGDLIVEKDEYWKLYTIIRQAIDIITSPAVSIGDIEILQDIIMKHNSLYVKLFGNLKPKMHIWLHYSRIILLNGPLIHYSTMMYERKNKKLKEIALGTSCNINLPYTIALRHQLQLCYAKELCPVLLDDVVLGPVNCTNANNRLQQLLSYNLPDNLSVCTLKFVEMCGKTFDVGTVLVNAITEGGPEFGIIQEIFFCKNIYLHIQVYNTKCFNNFYHAYEVDSTSDKPNIIANIKDIPRHPPCLYVVKNKIEFIATRYNV